MVKSIFREYYIFSCVFIFMLCSSTTYGEISFTSADEVTLPDSIIINDNTKFEFTDLNNDHFSEILIDNSYNFASFSLNAGNTIDFLNKKEKVLVDCCGYKYTYGYLDEDSLLDFVQAAIIESTDNFSVLGITYLSSSDFIPGDCTIIYITPDVGQYPDDEYDEYKVLSVKRLFLKDINGDGTKEVFGELEIYFYDCLYCHVFCGETIFPLLFKYELGDDSAREIDVLPYEDNRFYNLYGDSKLYGVMIEDGYSYRYGFHHTHGYSLYWSSIHVYKINSVILSYTPPYYHCCPMYWWASKTARIHLHSIDDVLSSSPGYEMLALVFQQSWAESGPPPYPTQYPSCVISSLHLVGYDISSRDSIVELWNDTLPDDRNIDLIFSNNRYTDQFFTFGNDRFYLHKSDNGDIIDSSATLDQGSSRIIAYNEIEKSGDPYAIFIEDHTLKLYSIDVATSVADDKPLPLPDAFKLKKPYPNPFNTTLNIPIDVVRRGKLEVKIFNILGQEIGDIFTGNVSPGELKLTWEANDAPSGIYLIQATMNSQPHVEKAVLLK